MKEDWKDYRYVFKCTKCGAEYGCDFVIDNGLCPECSKHKMRRKR